MTREDFKRLAAGNFAMAKPSIDPKEMSVYVDGAIFAWDHLQKRNITVSVTDKIAGYFPKVDFATNSGIAALTGGTTL